MPQSNVNLDEIDERLLTLLRDDARQTIAQLAKELGLSRGAIYSRLARLEEEKIVAGYTVRLGHAFAASRVRAHMMIKTLPRFHREVEQALASLPLVQAIHAISGEYDIIAMLEAEELGISSKNIDSLMNSNNPNIQRFVGKSGGIGQMLGISDQWAYNIVKQVGNYGESFDRNVGMGSPLKIERGLNALWTKGGLQYSPPIR